MKFYYVSASYVYREEGQPYEQGVRQHFTCPDNQAAIIAGIRWAIERGKSLEWGNPACIKVASFLIEEPQESGYIGSREGFDFFEWKYDTSPFTIEQLLEHHQQQKGV